MLHLVTGYKGEAHVTAADQGAFNAALIGLEDYVCKTGRQFEAQIMTNNSIRIYDGDLLMHGRHVSLKYNTFEDVAIENGTQSMKRNDLIVCRYAKDSTSGKEAALFVVIKGTPTEGTASDPVVTTGDILGGDILHEMPLYRVKIEGLSIVAIEKVFSMVSPVSEAVTHSDMEAHVKTHTSNKNNPHGVTAAQVGARPSTWMPTAEQVGAAKSSHAHSASDITSGTLPVSRGGTGATTFTSGAALIGAGTGAVTTRAITNVTTDTIATANTNLVTANTLVHNTNARLNRTSSIQNADTNYTTYMARGIALVNTVPTSMVNGAVAFVYE